MDDVTRAEYERAIELIKQAMNGDLYAAKWAKNHCVIAEAALRAEGADHVRI
jgi:hypothetical protein